MLKNEEVDFISSHGHTIFHQPKNNFTLQIGNGWQIARLTKTKTINNFRKKDISLNGQGAPLVPVGDKYLFPKNMHNKKQMIDYSTIASNYTVCATYLRIFWGCL